MDARVAARVMLICAAALVISPAPYVIRNAVWSWSLYSESEDGRQIYNYRGENGYQTTGLGGAPLPRFPALVLSSRLAFRWANNRLNSLSVRAWLQCGHVMLNMAPFPTPESTF